jgi:hypothetical protein
MSGKFLIHADEYPMTTAVEAMRQHIIDLCDANGILLRWFRRGDRDAYA